MTKQEHKPGHRMSMLSSKGKTKVYCTCGWQDEPRDPDQAVVGVNLYHRHVGLREKVQTR